MVYNGVSGAEAAVIPFLGGVRDAQAARGFVPVAPATVVAVDLHTGSVLWRQSGIGRPVAATATRLVTLASRGEAFVLRLLDAATGEDVGAVEPADWPQWAEGGTRLDAMHLSAAETTEGIRLRWQIHRGYGGGAAPSAAILAEADHDESGEMMVNLETGQSTPAPETTEAPNREASVAVAPGAGASDSPVRHQLGSRVFTLNVESRGASKVIVLASQDAATGASWETALGEAAARPGPLRK